MMRAVEPRLTVSDRLPTDVQFCKQLMDIEVLACIAMLCNLLDDDMNWLVGSAAPNDCR